MEEKPSSASFLDMLERMKDHLGMAGQVRRNLEERLKSLLDRPVGSEDPCAGGCED